MSKKFEVVISGVSGRFPECEDIETFKKILYNKENPITYNNRKWPIGYKYKFGEENIPLGTGKYTQLENFDARVFACSPILAKCTDVLNRKVLEPSFEAIIDAGINPVSLWGENIGCFMSATISEVESIKIFTKVGDKMYLLGGSKAMLSNRISFALNLTGLSYTYYSDVSGGLEALSAAYQNIREGRIEAALVGCSSSIIDPKISLSFLRLGFLSPDAICRAFDANANGYGRSEAAVVFFLQRSQDAKRSYGTLMFSDCYYLGSNPLTFIGYDEKHLENTLNEIYKIHDKVQPLDIAFLEMNACGVKRLDEIEASAVAKIFCKNREKPLLIGSVKSHSGHTEGSASMLSVLKALFALDSGFIAPNMHFTKPNPKIQSIIDGQLKVVSDITKLPGSIIGINSQGITGSVSHAIIKQNPNIKEETEITNDILPRLILVRGRTQDKLQNLIKKIELMPVNKEFVSLTNDIFKVPIQTHAYRGYAILPASSKASNAIDVSNSEKRPIWFVFSGMGSQWNGMGNGLLEIPAFVAAIERCDAVLKPKGINIRHILTSNDPSLFNNILNAFVGIISVQIGLIDILKTIGIKPDGLIGHSVGENACGYADNCLSLEQAVLSSYARGVASNEANTIKGMMAAIGKGYNEIKSSLPEGIEVACHNSPENCTLTGPTEIVNKFVKKLKQQRIFAKTVNVSNIAYHSKHIAPAAPILLKYLSEVITKPKERSKKWISTSVPESDWDKPKAKYCSAEYLTNNLISSVLFEEGCRHIPENAIIIEIAPHGLLQAILKRSLDSKCTNIPLTLRSIKSNSVEFLLSAIGKLFIAGCYPDVNALYPKINYPVPRNTPCTSILATWDHTDNWSSIEPVKDKSLSEEIIKIKINKGSKFSYINGHQILNRKIIPPSLYMYLVWHMFSIIKNEKMENLNIVFENIKIHRNLHITLEKYRGITIMIQHGSGNFEILLNNEKKLENIKPIMNGTIKVPYENTKILIDNTERKIKFEISDEEFYKNLENLGYRLQGEFINVEGVAFSETESFGHITWNKNWVCFLDSLMKLYIYSDSRKNERLLFPNKIRNLTIYASVFKEFKTGTKLFYHFDMITKQLRCNGLELTGLNYCLPEINFFHTESINSKIQGMRFISYSNPDIQNVSQFLELSLLLCVENTVWMKKYRGSKVRVIDLTKSTSDTIRKIIKNNPNLKFDIALSNYEELLFSINVSRKNNYFIILNDVIILEKLLFTIETELKNLFVLLISPIPVTSFPIIQDFLIEIMKKKIEKMHFHLYKKISKQKRNLSPIIATNNNYFTKIFKNREKKLQKIIIIKNNVELQDLDLILSKKDRFSNISYFFILDVDAPKFSVENSIYKNQIILDLAINILRNGEWGLYRNLKSDLLQINDKLIEFKIHPSELWLQNVNIKCINPVIDPNENDKIIMENKYEYNFEYSGLTNTDKRIMGLAQYKRYQLQEPDPYFMWFIPEYWNLEEACTVPLLYAQVYDILFLNPLKESTNSIFINTTDLLFIEACITVFSHQNYTIFVTVSDNVEANYLKMKFPKLKESHILPRDCKYDLQLKYITKGRGVNLVINCISDSKQLKASVNCLARFGHYIEMTDGNYDDDTKIGLFIFLKSVSFTFISNKLSHLLSLPIEMKNLLHNLIDNGIKEGVIKPLPKIIATKESVLRINEDENKKNVKKVYVLSEADNIDHLKMNRKLKLDNIHSFIIISDNKNEVYWFELVQWLIDEGAQKFVIVLDNYSTDSKCSYEINRLLIKKEVTMILTSFKRTETVDDARNLILEANNIAPLEAVFIVSIDYTRKCIENMDTASRGLTPFHFVCLFSGGLKQCELRRKDNLPAVLVYSANKIIELHSTLSQMKQILINFNYLTSPLLYELSHISESKQCLTPLSDYLFKDLQTLEKIGYHVTKTPKFIETTFLSKKYSETKGVYPVFIIPSMDESSLKSLTKNLIYPIFCMSFTECCHSVSKTASLLLKDLQKIQPYGPVTLIGETWSGSVSIELASLLHSEKRAVQLFLIEGSPTTWQKHIERLGEINTPQFDYNLLKEILNENLEIKYENQNESWQNSVKKHLKNLKFSENEAKSILKVINGIRNRLVMTAQYTSPKEMLKNVILFKQKQSESSLEKYSLSDEIHLIKEEKYEDFLKNREISRIINENAHFSW